MIDIFDIMGPIMVGPSSSHTAGAAVIGALAGKIMTPPIKKVEFTLYGFTFSLWQVFLFDIAAGIVAFVLREVFLGD